MASHSAEEFKSEATVPYDPRFPMTNQTKNCWINYVDAKQCTEKHGEDASQCKQFLINYKSLCPTGWTEKWDEQWDNGTFPLAKSKK